MRRHLTRVSLLCLILATAFQTWVWREYEWKQDQIISLVLTVALIWWLERRTRTESRSPVWVCWVLLVTGLAVSFAWSYEPASLAVGAVVLTSTGQAVLAAIAIPQRT